VWQISRPPANGANLESFLIGPFVKNGFLPSAQNGPIPKKFGQNYLKFNFSRGDIYKK
jgi:hypothetical protein